MVPYCSFYLHSLCNFIVIHVGHLVIKANLKVMFCILMACLNLNDYHHICHMVIWCYLAWLILWPHCVRPLRRYRRRWMVLIRLIEYTNNKYLWTISISHWSIICVLYLMESRNEIELIWDWRFTLPFWWKHKEEFRVWFLI